MESCSSTKVNILDIPAKEFSSMPDALFDCFKLHNNDW
jgi:hypothetical protein